MNYANYILSIFLFLPISLLSQSYEYKRIKTNEGLPSSQVYHVFQDSKGYIWFATDNGVCKYNGYEIKNYTVNNGLPNNTVFEICEDSKKRIWFVSKNAFISYYYNDSIYLYEHSKVLHNSLKKTSSYGKRSFYIDEEETLYYNDYESLLIQINKQGKLIKTDSNAHIIVTKNQAFTLNLANAFCNDTLISLIDNNEIWKSKLDDFKLNYSRVAIFHHNTLFLSMGKYLYCFKEGKQISRKEFPSTIIWLSFQNNQLWVGTFSGAYNYLNKNIPSLKPENHHLKDFAITSVCVDNENGIWFSTLYNGVMYLPNPNVKSYTLSKNNAFKSNISCLYSNSNYNYFTNNSGQIGYIEKDNLKLIHAEEDLSISGRYKKLLEHDSHLYLLSITDLYKIKKSSHDTVFKLNKFCDFGGRNVLLDRNENVWILKKNYIRKYSQEQQLIYDKPIHKYKIEVYCGIEINENELLFGTTKGLWKLNILKDTFIQSQIINEKTGRITSIQKGYNGELLIGTKERGLIFLSNDTIVSSITTKNGLLSNWVKVVKKHNGYYWVGTNNGVNKIKPDYNNLSRSSIQFITTSHGLISNEINDIEITDHSTIIASNKGINTLSNKYENSTIQPFIYFEKININNQSTDIKDKFVLNHDENNINIKLEGLAYKLSGKIKYKYRLINSSKNTQWKTTNNRSIQFDYLSPDLHIFEAKAINENNIESKSIKATFIIKPPFWKTWWFYTIITVLIIMLIFIIYQVRISKIKKRILVENKFIAQKKELENQIERYRHQALRQQMNPHFIFNSLNSIQLYIFNNNRDLSLKFLSKFSKLIRIIFENSQEQLISFETECKALKLYIELERMRLNNKFEFELTIDSSIDTEWYKIPPLFIQPFVENAIWHGIVNLETKGKIKLHLKELEHCFLCIIEDDGVGRVKAKELSNNKYLNKKSMGINITKKRLDLLKTESQMKFSIFYSDLYKHKENTGTRVEIEIPKLTGDE